MIDPAAFFKLLKEKEFYFFCGVPDSLLKDLCAYITDNTKEEEHIITANEGNAIALAAGYHLATDKIGVVYMQNSGLGNGVNPLTSLTDPEVYSIPLLLLIGWRGEPGVNDEPQHIKKGRITINLLNTLEIPFSILPPTIEQTKNILEQARQYLIKNKAPYALIIRNNTFEKYSLQKKKKTDFPLTRETAIELIINHLEKNAIIVSTTGKTSRELFELRQQHHHNHETDFLTVGSMGHASSIALGVALQKPTKKVFCFDGDGAVIMHMGALSSIGQLKPKNYYHIMFNNFAHDSVGGQPTAANVINLTEIAKHNGYNKVYSTTTEEEIIQCLNEMNQLSGPHFLEIKVNKGSRENLGRPTTTPIQNKQAFMNFVQRDII